ncbi:MAG: pyruvate ferredoxin oxidoreductase [Armatimonadia bacterium]
MGKVMPLEGNMAVAEAMRQINPDVVAAYPITPSTEVVQTFARFVADGQVKTNFVAVESEHSAMSACVAAAAAGGRVMNATSANGLALMWEILYIVSSLRQPVILTLVNRALSGNINIHCDHSDGMGARDAGWIQLYGENCQESYDNLIQCTAIAERLDVRLPIMNCLDGFLVSHSYELVEVESDEDVQKFVGPYKPVKPLLDIKNPYTMGPIDLQDFYMEHKRNQWEAYGAAKKAIVEEGKRFGEMFGREYGLMELVDMDDADIADVALGSAAGTCKDIVASLREQGVKAGLLKLRSFRPFPAEEIAAALKGCKAVADMDRAASYGGGTGPLFPEVAAAMAMSGFQVPMLDYIYGLGGRELPPEQISTVYDDLAKLANGQKPEQVVQWLGVRA